MRIARFKDADLHWRDDGARTGKTIVFANSLGTDLRLWDAVIDLLPRDRYRLIRFDKRGHGLSSCPQAPYSMDALVDDTQALLDHAGVDECVFVGLSIGGMIGQSLAARRPDLVKALVLSNTAAKMGDAAMWQDRIAVIRAGGIEALAEPILERWFSEEFRSTDELTAWRSMLTRTPREGYIGCCEAIAGADLTASTSALRLPVLAIAGDRDLASPPSLVKATANLVAGSRYREMAGAGHLPCVEQPSAYKTILMEFLEETGHV